MNGEKFVNIIIDYYKQSRELSIDREGFDIWRGVSHSISSRSEDLFALMVAQELNDKSLEFIVDKTFSMKINDGSNIQFRPDLAIVKGKTLTHIIDLKMDMGYKRRYHESEAFSKESKKFNLLREKDFASISYKRYGKRKELDVVKNIFSQIVVISERNEGKEQNRLDMIASINQLDWVEIYYLSGSVHPNTYVESNLKNIKVNQPEFDRLFNDIRKNLK